MIASRKPDLALCWGTLPGTSLYELIELAAAADFATLAVTAGHYQRARAAGDSPASIRQRLKDAGVTIAVIDPLIGPLPGVPPAETVKEQFREFLRFTEDDCFQAALVLESPIVNLAHFLGSPVPLAELGEKVAALSERARREGIKLSIEFIPDTGIPDMATAQALRALAGEGVGVMFDTWHFVRSGGRPSDLQGLERGSILGLQFSDRIPPEPGAAYVPMAGRLLPGEGQQPLADYLRLLLPAAAGVPIGIEVFSAELNALPRLEAARKCAAAMRKVLERV